MTLVRALSAMLVTLATFTSEIRLVRHLQSYLGVPLAVELVDDGRGEVVLTLGDHRYVQHRVVSPGLPSSYNLQITLTIQNLPQCIHKWSSVNSLREIIFTIYFKLQNVATSITKLGLVLVVIKVNLRYLLLFLII